MLFLTPNHVKAPKETQYDIKSIILMCAQKLTISQFNLTNGTSQQKHTHTAV